MSKLVRRTFLQFGSTVNPGSEIGQYGSYSAPIYSGDVGTMQAGTAWPRGWFAETINTNRPFIQDFNAVDFVFSYMIFYLLEMGIAEWDSGTNYFTNSVCQIAGQIYISLVDNNLNNNPSTSPTDWQSGLPGSELSGVIKPYAGSVAPAGYLLCNGQAVSRTTYAALYAICGTAYGAGNGSTTFNVPNLQGVIPVAQLVADPNFGTIGGIGGEATHTLIVNEIPSHTHNLPSYVGGSNPGPGGLPVANATTGGPYNKSTDGGTGGGVAHNNVQPYQTIGSYIIKT